MSISHPPAVASGSAEHSFDHSDGSPVDAAALPIGDDELCGSFVSGAGRIQRHMDANAATEQRSDRLIETAFDPGTEHDGIAYTRREVIERSSVSDVTVGSEPTATVEIEGMFAVERRPLVGELDTLPHLYGQAGNACGGSLVARARLQTMQGRSLHREFGFRRMTTDDPTLSEVEVAGQHEQICDATSLRRGHERPRPAAPQIRLYAHVHEERGRGMHQCVGSVWRRLLISSWIVT